MTNIVHASMTGAEVHEPKGIETAHIGDVYTANGSGSGSWSNVGTSSFTGMIADFTWPVVQSGWLELDGSDINTTTYSALYNVMTIQQTGTRVNGGVTITSLSNTGPMRAGYYVFGVGISAGSRIISVDSVNQITISTPATSSGTSQVVVSPWLLDIGTIRLPDLSSAARYRRSRGAGLTIGQTLDDQNKTHDHGVSGTTGTSGGSHSHGFSVSGDTGTESATHTHRLSAPENVFTTSVNNGAASLQSGLLNTAGGGGAGLTTTTETATHTHNINLTGLTTATTNIDHTHSFSTTSATSGGSEARPLSIVVMTCVKT